MEFILPGNILNREPQTIEIDKVAALIGENGSGKSTILKSIFDARLQGNALKNKKIVCFSSGQNESFSSLFSGYLTKERQANRSLGLDCFFYDKPWSKLLIFLATASKMKDLSGVFCVKKVM